MHDKNVAARLWARAAKADGDGCWTWTGAKTKAGYGQISVRGRPVYTHRLSFELQNGPLGPGMCALHKCDNPPCCRPDHLFEGTRIDNMKDKVAKGRQHRGEATGGVVLTDAKAAEILVAYATKEFSLLELAEEYGVEEHAIRMIVNGETWAHVPGPRLSREEIVAHGKANRARERIRAKQAAGWPPGACSNCRVRGHYYKTCPMPRRAA